MYVRKYVNVCMYACMHMYTHMDMYKNLPPKVSVIKVKYKKSICGENFISRTPTNELNTLTNSH